MKSLIKVTAAILPIAFSFMLLSATEGKNEILTPLPPFNATPKIQVAVLLDVSNSMDGLIEQAKAQLWNMVSVMGKAKCNEITPKIEIALYEYGRSNKRQHRDM